MAINKSVYTSLDAEETQIYETIYGKFNECPPNFKEVSQEEFAEKFKYWDSWSAKFIEYRQMNKHMNGEKLKKSVCGHLYFYSGSGYCMIATGYNPTVMQFYLFDYRDSLKNWFESLDIVEKDSKWDMDKITSRPSRGIRDYDRMIIFKRKLTTSEWKYMMQYYNEIECPGWTGVIPKKLNDLTYKFSTTYDSSD
jgi:hypothetical protein